MDQENSRRFPHRWIAAGSVLVAIAGVVFVYARMRPSKQVDPQRDVLYYVDPMHPAYKSDKPGIAPDCGMDLVPVYAKDAGRFALEARAAIPSGVSIEPENQQLYGITVAPVQISRGEHTVRAFGRVAADDTRMYRLNVSTAGFLKDTYQDAVGMRVRKDQKLATIYSSELNYAVSGYLSGNLRIPSGGMRDTTASPDAQNSQSRTDYLRNLGMSTAQIAELQNTRKVPNDIYIESPVDGIILSRNASRGMRFEKNTELYSILDLSHVWVLADVFGSDATAFRPGAAATITLPDTGEAFRARVSAVLPEIDPATRTLKARLELDNPKLRLRPDMFVTVELADKLPAGLTVPADAILDTGLMKRVFVQTTSSHFELRTVETGWRVGDRVQIRNGLEPGEMVVSSGTFLVDSESRLHADDTQALGVPASRKIDAPVRSRPELHE